jgi:hypothetical protein
MLPTNGQAIDGYAIGNGVINGMQSLQTFYYPSRPFNQDATIPIELTTQNDVMQLYQLLAIPYAQGDITMLVQVVDCNGAPVPGAQVVLQPAGPGTIVYVDPTGTPMRALTMTTQNGLAIVFNQPNIANALYSANATVGMFHTYQLAPPPPNSLIEVVIQP